MVPYVIRQGDHVPKLAAKMQFDAEAIWLHPQNATLRSRRMDMHILCPGDVLYVPEPPSRRWLSVTVGAMNRFVATVPTVALKVTFADAGRPLASKPCRVRELSNLGDLTTNGAGQLAFQAPVTTEILTIEFPTARLVHELHVGHLDPVTELSGVFQRLQNLGYTSIDPRSIGVDLDEDSIRDPVARFQSDQGDSAPSGDIDDETRKNLETAHGC
jgi:hypothetical protein